jgi:hypothetical protein
VVLGDSSSQANLLLHQGSQCKPLGLGKICSKNIRFDCSSSEVALLLSFASCGQSSPPRGVQRKSSGRDGRKKRKRAKELCKAAWRSLAGFTDARHQCLVTLLSLVASLGAPREILFHALVDTPMPIRELAKSPRSMQPRGVRSTECGCVNGRLCALESMHAFVTPERAECCLDDRLSGFDFRFGGLQGVSSDVRLLGDKCPHSIM